MKKLKGLSIYILSLCSCAAVIIYLVNQNLVNLKIPEKVDFLLLSFFFLFSGFVFQVFAWKKIFIIFNESISYPLAFASLGFTIFSKYIPGKVLVVLGPAQIVSRISNISFKISSYASLALQLVSLCCGCLVGSYFILVDLDIAVRVLAIIFLVFVSILGLNFVTRLIFKFNSNVAGLIYSWLYLLGSWLCWSVGFFLLCRSYDIDINSLFLVSIFSISALNWYFIYSCSGVGWALGRLQLLAP